MLPEKTTPRRSFAILPSTVATQTYLSVLTFLGLAVGLGSGLISQLKRTSVDINGTNEKRLTSAGKLALAISLIGFAGSFASELLKSAIASQQERDSKKEKDEEKKWKDRSNELSAEILRNTTKALEDSLQTRFAITNTGQKVLTDNVNRTRRVLETIWTESNRVNPANIRVQIAYTYLSEMSQLPPRLFEKDWKVSIRALMLRGTKELIATKWSSAPLITDKEAQMLLVASDQRITERLFRSTASPSFQQISDFADFTGEMGPFSSMTKWNGATIEVHLTAGSPYLKDKLRTKNSDKESDRLEIEALKREYDLTEALAFVDYRIDPLPVAAKVTVFVKDRPIATSRATLVAVNEHDGDISGLVVAKFPLMEIKEDTFPQFASRAARSSLKTLTPQQEGHGVTHLR